MNRWLRTYFATLLIPPQQKSSKSPTKSAPSFFLICEIRAICGQNPVKRTMRYHPQLLFCHNFTMKMNHHLAPPTGDRAGVRQNAGDSPASCFPPGILRLNADNFAYRRLTSPQISSPPPQDSHPGQTCAPLLLGKKAGMRAVTQNSQLLRNPLISRFPESHSPAVARPPRQPASRRSDVRRPLFHKLVEERVGRGGSHSHSQVLDFPLFKFFFATGRAVLRRRPDFSAPIRPTTISKWPSPSSARQLVPSSLSPAGSEIVNGTTRNVSPCFTSVSPFVPPPNPLFIKGVSGCTALFRHHFLYAAWAPNFRFQVSGCQPFQHLHSAITLIPQLPFAHFPSWHSLIH